MTSMTARIRSLFDDELVGWGVGRWLALSFLAFPFVTGLAVIATRAVSQGAYVRLIREDGPIEWASFVAWEVGAVGAALLAARLWRRRRTAEACFWSIVLIGAFVAGGEEISWGQRILGIGTPEALQKVNEQGEINVHNLTSVDNAVRVLMLLLGLYGSVFALAVRDRFLNTHGEAVELLVPPLFLFSMFFFIAAFRLAWFVLLAPEPLRDTPVSYGELAEMCAALGMALFACLGARRLWRPGEEPARPRQDPVRTPHVASPRQPS